jgi:hypothetical protein
VGSDTAARNGQPSPPCLPLGNAPPSARPWTGRSGTEQLCSDAVRWLRGEFSHQGRRPRRPRGPIDHRRLQRLRPTQSKHGPGSSGMRTWARAIRCSASRGLCSMETERPDHGNVPAGCATEPDPCTLLASRSHIETASARWEACNLRRIAFTCDFTVPSPINSCRAICPLVNPLLTRRKTSISRRVKELSTALPPR